MTGSLDAAYFDGIFASDDDPWDLASSAYEAAKFDHTLRALSDRRYDRALEIGCAHGVLTKRLVSLCDTLLAVDISAHALAKARERMGDHRGLVLRQMAFPRQTPDDAAFDLVVLSEVAYYWGGVDLERAGAWLRSHIVAGGRVILVHYTGETDYPQSGDEAVEKLWAGVADDFSVEQAEQCTGYRLDLWKRR